MSLIWGGKLNGKVGKAVQLINKLNYANSYGRMFYSTKAYPSPSLTENEWETVFKIIDNKLYNTNYLTEANANWIFDDSIKSVLLDEVKEKFKNRYYNRPNYDSPYQSTYEYDKEKFYVSPEELSFINNSPFVEGLENASERYDVSGNLKPIYYNYYEYKAMPPYVIYKLRQAITELSHVGEIETTINSLDYADRMEKCIVTKKGGLVINTKDQLDNLLRYYQDDKRSSYTIFYDAKTMLPLVNVVDDKINDTETFKVKVGTVYYKFTRTVKNKEYEKDGILGRSFVIDAETFPDDYKIVGETYIRNQKTGKDQRCQIIIYKANVSSETSITLEAEGDPTVFSMGVDVLVPENDIQMEIRVLEVEDDTINGGTKIVPVKDKYSFTQTEAEYTTVEVPIDNNEIY